VALDDDFAEDIKLVVGVQRWMPAIGWALLALGVWGTAMGAFWAVRRRRARLAKLGQEDKQALIVEDEEESGTTEQESSLKKDKDLFSGLSTEVILSPLATSAFAAPANTPAAVVSAVNDRASPASTPITKRLENGLLPVESQISPPMLTANAHSMQPALMLAEPSPPGSVDVLDDFVVLNGDPGAKTRPAARKPIRVEPESESDDEEEYYGPAGTAANGGVPSKYRPVLATRPSASTLADMYY